MSYTFSQPLGNNAFSYDLRRQLGSDTTLVISDPCEISSLDQIQLGDFIVFEEIDHGGDLQSHTGLTHTYILNTPSCKIIITDNHNHVLPYWLNHISEYQERTNISSLPYSLIHIDQHSDLGPNSNQLDLSQLYNLQYQWDFSCLQCNIGNFVTPCIESGLITEMIQIRTEYTLELKSEKYKVEGSSNFSSLTSSLSPLIVDIDLDFRAPEMGISDKIKTMSQVRSIMNHADLITIATSPYFIDQPLALELLCKLLGPRLAKGDRNDTL